MSVPRPLPPCICSGGASCELVRRLDALEGSGIAARLEFLETQVTQLQAVQHSADSPKCDASQGEEHFRLPLQSMEAKAIVANETCQRWTDYSADEATAQAGETPAQHFYMGDVHTGTQTVSVSVLSKACQTCDDYDDRIAYFEAKILGLDVVADDTPLVGVVASVDAASQTGETLDNTSDGSVQTDDVDASLAKFSNVVIDKSLISEHEVDDDVDEAASGSATASHTDEADLSLVKGTAPTSGTVTWLAEARYKPKKVALEELIVLRGRFPWDPVLAGVANLSVLG